MRIVKAGLFAVLTLGLAACASNGTRSGDDAASVSIPVDYYELDNGLRVVLSQDDTAPIATVAVYYNIGFRIEPRDRTGFAHLFEHMMFQGSENLGKMEFVRLVQKNGGALNGSTRFDFTNYFEIVPSNAIETMLWAEADRMSGLAITQENLTNQQGVVKNEVKVNVLNQPYGGFPWLWLPQIANENWYNAHNFYGELSDLDAATLEDVKSFFDNYYAPNNAVVVVDGDFDKAEVKGWIEKYFGDIPATELKPKPDISEPRQVEEKTETMSDPLAPRPGFAFAYHMPERNTPEYFAMGLINQLLLQGDDALLSDKLVREKGYGSSINGGINWPLGNMFNYDGPMLISGSLIHDASIAPDDIKASLDEVIERLRNEGVTQEDLDKAMVKMRARLYSLMEGFNRADLLASFALFDDEPARINELEAKFRAVTPELVQQAAQEYLRPTNRTVLIWEPADKSGDKE